MCDEKTPITPGVYRFKVSEELSGMRLDQYMAAAGRHWSRGMARKVIDLGGVHYDGRRTRRTSLTVNAGKKIEVFIDHQPLEKISLLERNILFRDDDLIVINKPVGMPTQPTPARYKGTLFAELQLLLKNSVHKEVRPSIGMVQRLDRDTSGVMVFSINKRAHKKLTEQFREHTIEKIYLAMVSGCPEHNSGKIISHLARRRSTNLTVSVDKGGKYAETRYRVLQWLGEFGLLEVNLVTGRSHQIRAHFSENRMPLLGDKAYGGLQTINNYKIVRQMLHARSLSFLHPVTGEQMSFEAQPPNDFSELNTFLAGSLNGMPG